MVLCRADLDAVHFVEDASRRTCSQLRICANADTDSSASGRTGYDYLSFGSAYSSLGCLSFDGPRSSHPGAPLRNLITRTRYTSNSTASPEVLEYAAENVPVHRLRHAATPCGRWPRDEKANSLSVRKMLSTRCDATRMPLMRQMHQADRLSACKRPEGEVPRTPRR